MEYLLTFLEGFASFISPCILPLVPVYISYFMGVSENNNKRFKAFINSIFFVFGFTLVFIIVALLTATASGFLNKYIFYIKLIFAIILILWGLDYMEIIKIKVPQLQLKNKFDTYNLNFVKSFLFGMFFSISHAPCTGLFLASALALIAKEQDILKGISLMICYSVGLGIPFILSAVLIDKMKNVFGFIKKNYKVVKIICGIIIIITGVYLLF